MPTLEHGGLVEMFRDNPALAPHLLEALFHVELPRHASIGVVNSSLDQLTPVEFRADLVIELKDAAGRVVLSIILEVQLAPDPDKKFSWPVYLAVERSRKRCPVIVLVVAPDGAVAAWAAEGIDLGMGCSSVRPLVVGPSALPEVTEQETADREVELAVLSAMAHGNGPNGLAVVLAAFNALRRLDQEHAAVYFQLIYDALREPMRRALEKLIMESQTQAKATLPPFAQNLVERGKLEGMREGKLEGMREGTREGKLEAKREALLRLMARLGLDLAEDQRARIQACTDVATLDRWFDGAFGAKTAADVLT